MKRNKGFTLIELLAVIVILAIIALIATPIVLNIIKDSKDSATLQSAQFYIDAVETAVAKKIIDDPTFKPKSCEIQRDGNLKCDGKENIIEVEVSGEKPTSGTIDLEQGKIKDVNIKIEDKTIVKKDNKLVFEEESTDDYIIDEDLEFAYDEQERAYVAYLTITKDITDKFKVGMSYDSIIDNGEVKKIYGIEHPHMGFILYTVDEKSRITAILIDDEKLTFIAVQELVEKHNIKIGNPRPTEERMFFFISDYGSIAIGSYDFIVGSANILIKDSEGNEYFNNIVELEENSEGTIGADSGCRNNIPNLPDIYNALVDGKTITIEVTQTVDNKEIVSTISRNIDEMIYSNKMYLSSDHPMCALINPGC